MKRVIFCVLCVLYGCPAFAGVRFDGVDDVLHSNTHLPFAFTNVISISFWLNKEVGMAASCEFLGKGRVLSGNKSHWQVRDSGANKFDFYFANPDATFRIFTTSSAYAQTNVPIHVAFTYNWTSSNSAQFYVNGSRVAGVWTSNPANTTGLTNAEPFRIGTTYAGSSAKCRMWEVAVWNGILTDAEVYSLASRKRGLPMQIQPGNLKFYAPLEDFFASWSTISGSNALVDVTQFHTPLTPLNSPTQHPPQWITPR